MAYEELLNRHAAGGAHLAAAGAEGLAAPPTLHATVVTCMDARIDPFTLFGLHVGEVHVLRNAGGVVTPDVLRSLAISQRKLGTRDVLLVQHSGCGMGTFADDDFTEELAQEVGVSPTWRPQTFRDPVVSVRRDLAQLQRDPFLHPDMRVRGFVLDIVSFTLEEVFVEGELSAAG